MSSDGNNGWFSTLLLFFWTFYLLIMFFLISFIFFFILNFICWHQCCRNSKCITPKLFFHFHLDGVTFLPFKVKGPGSAWCKVKIQLGWNPNRLQVTPIQFSPSSPTSWMFVRCGRKLKKKTHANTGRTCKTVNRR